MSSNHKPSPVRSYGLWELR